MTDLAALARDIIDANSYMVLGTADEAGRPWVSPVWFAPDGYADLYWVSSPEATHSRNLAARPELGIVIFDSQVPIGSGQGVYMSAVALVLAGAEAQHGIGVFSTRSLEQGGRAWSVEDVRPSRPYRLYKASVSQYWVLDPERSPDQRTRVDPTAGPEAR
jgi:hypothetical protein